MFIKLNMLSLIVAFDSHFGIGKNGKLPWNIKEDMLFFMDVTKNNINNPSQMNAIILGRLTYESIGAPLKDRINIVVSSSLTNNGTNNGIDNNNILVTNTVDAAIKKAHDMKCPNIFICGGGKIYEYALKNYVFDNIYITHINHDYECDTFIKINVSQYPLISSKSFLIDNKYVGFRHYGTAINEPYFPASQEIQYLGLIEKILRKKHIKKGRNGNTLSIFGEMLEFDVSESIPVLTTKKINTKNVIEELLFFLNGHTDTNILSSKGVNIWKQNTCKEFLEKNSLTSEYKDGDMGPMYGYQLLHFGEKYEGCDKEYKNGFDQLEYCLKLLKTDPFSRRILMTTYNPIQAPEGCLYPCHGISIIFNVDNDYKLSCMMTQRSVDVMCGLPWNIFSYATLIYIMCELVNNDEKYDGVKLTPGKLVMSLADTHIYEIHREQAVRQVLRMPFKFPKLNIIGKPTDIKSMTSDNFVISDYIHHPYLPVNMVA